MADKAPDQEAPPASKTPPADQVAAESTPPEATPAEPTPPESAPEDPQGDQPKSLEEAIKAVLPEEDGDPEDPEKDGGDPSKETAPADKADPAQDGSDADTKPKDKPSDDELTAEDKDLKPNAQKRIGQLLHERKDLRAEVVDLKANAEAATPLARDMTAIRTFMAENDMSTDQATQLFDFGAKYRRGDWAGVLAVIQPIMDQALLATGRVLSEDLQAMVTDGRISEEDAKAISLSRGKLATDAAAHKADADRATATLEGNTARTTEVLNGQIKNAMNNWVAQRQATDPDFDRKSSLIMDLAKAHAKDKGHPQSAEDAVAVMDAIYTRVTGLTAAPKDPPKPTAQTPDGLSGNAPSTAKPPANLKEAIFAA